MLHNLWINGARSIFEEEQNVKSSGFVHREISYMKDSVIIYDCSFDLSLYNRLLFKEFDIYFPPQIQRAVNKRQAEFLAGRYAAQQAILKLPVHFIQAPTIHIGENRCPIWPYGIKGSITHSNARALCAVMISDLKENKYIGIDIEDYLSNDTASMLESSIHTEREKNILLGHGIPNNVATTLIFSAKESLFKALYPFVGEYFDFECAEVSGVDLNKNFLSIGLSNDFALKFGLNKKFSCHFRLEKNELFTIISNP